MDVHILSHHHSTYCLLSFMGNPNNNNNNKKKTNKQKSERIQSTEDRKDSVGDKQGLVHKSFGFLLMSVFPPAVSCCLLLLFSSHPTNETQVGKASGSSESIAEEFRRQILQIVVVVDGKKQNHQNSPQKDQQSDADDVLCDSQDRTEDLVVKIKKKLRADNVTGRVAVQHRVGSEILDVSYTHWCDGVSLRDEMRQEKIR